jgi:hypothetical protein
LKQIINIFAIIGLFSLKCLNPVIGQIVDWRNVKYGNLIYKNGYCDQPYVIVLENGKWLCVLTTNSGHEGTKGQHIVSCISEDQGKKWSVPVQIEKPGTESSSWAMPYLTKYGRVYVFYIYNGDKIHKLKGNYNYPNLDRNNIREDMLGWYCYKYTDDEGKTWSERYRLDVRKTEVDLNNNWQGEVQIMWGIGKPVDVDNGMMFAFTKIGQYMFDYSEGWFFRCSNINNVKNPKKLKWLMFPDGQTGLKNEKYGYVNEEQNIFQMNDGTIYCMHRTISGHPLESYSRDGGKSWTLPAVPRYEDGIELKNPRAFPRIWKCENGKYLLWYHNNGSWNWTSRNPAWISGGLEKDGKIIWSQPEILFYIENPDEMMSYPDLIEQDGKYWITETNKVNARCHSVPADFLNLIWTQFERSSITSENLVAEWKENELKPGCVLNIPKTDEINYQEGFTIDFRIKSGDLAPGQPILNSKSKNGKTLKLQTDEYGSVRITLNDGNNTEFWNSDPGLIPAYGEHCISVTIDNGPKIIQFVVNGTVCNGRDFRQYGWGCYKANMGDFSFDTIQTSKLERRMIKPLVRLTNLRIYNRPLKNTELIGNHRNFMKLQQDCIKDQKILSFNPGYFFKIGFIGFCHFEFCKKPVYIIIHYPIFFNTCLVSQSCCYIACPHSSTSGNYSCKICKDNFETFPDKGYSAVSKSWHYG